MSDNESDFYTNLAATLHTIADDIATLAGRGLTELVHVAIRFQPTHGQPDPVKVAAVDAIGQALLGKPGELQRMSGGSYHHNASGHRGDRPWPQNVEVAAYCGVESPEKRALQDEIERLTAERDRLAAQIQQPEQPEETP